MQKAQGMQEAAKQQLLYPEGDCLGEEQHIPIKNG